MKFYGNFDLTIYEMDFILLWNAGNFITQNLAVKALCQSNSYINLLANFIWYCYNDKIC